MHCTEYRVSQTNSLKRGQCNCRAELTKLRIVRPLEFSRKLNNNTTVSPTNARHNFQFAGVPEACILHFSESLPI